MSIAYITSHAAANPTSPATPSPALTNLLLAADEALALALASPPVPVATAAAEVDPSALAAEEGLVPELTAELTDVAIADDVADVADDDDDGVTATPDVVAGLSATTIVVAVAVAVALTPTKDRTHEAAATEYRSK